MNPNLVIGVTYEDGSIRGEPNAIALIETKRDQSRAKLSRVARPSLELEIQLCFVARPVAADSPSPAEAEE